MNKKFNQWMSKTNNLIKKKTLTKKEKELEFAKKFIAHITKSTN